MKRDIIALLCAFALIAGLALAGRADAADGPSDADKLAILWADYCERTEDVRCLTMPSPTPSAAPSLTPSPEASAPATPSAVPTATTSPTPSPTSIASPPSTPTATAAPSASPSPTPTPPTTPPPTPPTSSLFDLSGPTSGTAWTTLKSWADRTTTPNLSDQDNQGDVVALAKALVYARTGDAKYRDGAISLLRAARGTELRGDTLGIARGVAPIALAALLVDYRDASWSSWLAGLRTWVNPDRSYTLVSIQEKRPNNWGTHASASRIAIDLYLNDRTDLDRAATVFRGYLGDRAAYAGFTYGDLSWQADASKPVGVNPKGATKGGANIDGILPDDARRGGSCCTLSGDGVSYTWEASQGIALAAYLLDRAGYAVTSWADGAVCRVYARTYALGHPPSGDDLWQPSVVNDLCGTRYATSASAGPGKSAVGFPWLLP